MSTTSMQTTTADVDEYGQPVDPTGWTPTSVELSAELALLGSMLMPSTATHSDGTTEELNSPAVGDVATVLQPHHLFRPAHRSIMAAILDIAGRGERVDPVTVGGELEHRGELGKVGGGAYLHTLLASTPTATNATHYADQVREAANRRAALEYAERVRYAAADRSHGEPLDVAMDRAWRTYEEATSGSANEGLAAISDDVETLTSVLEQWGTESPGAFTTGLADLDRVLNVEQGGLVVLGARSGVGKSTMAGRIARHYVFDRNEHVVVFNMEMSRHELVERDFAALARIRLDSASGKTKLDTRERTKLIEAAEKYQDGGHRMHLDDTRSVGLAHIRSRLRQVHHQQQADGGIGLVVVDQLHLMNRPAKDREDQEFTEITRQLKVLAGEFNCIIVLVAQLNRGPESRPDGKPRASDLKASGGTEQDADVVMLLHDVGTWTDDRLGEMDVILDKQRKGISHATVALADHRHHASFESMTPQ